MDDVDNARVWAGLHYRTSMVEGGALGSKVVKHVTKDYFVLEADAEWVVN